MADDDDFRIRARPYTSWEVVVDGTGGDIGSGAGPSVQRLLSDGVTVAQDSLAAGAGASRSLSWENATTSAASEFVRVRSSGCGTDCGPADVYRIRALDTTYSISRFNNSGVQTTIVVLQNVAPYAIAGHLWFWDGGGALVASQPFLMQAHATLVVNTAALAAGLSGSLTVSSDGRYGDLAGKALAVEAATGFTFDTPLLPRPR